MWSSPRARGARSQSASARGPRAAGPAGAPARLPPGITKSTPNDHPMSSSGSPRPRGPDRPRTGILYADVPAGRSQFPGATSVFRLGAGTVMGPWHARQRGIARGSSNRRLKSPRSLPGTGSSAAWRTSRDGRVRPQERPDIDSSCLPNTSHCDSSARSRSRRGTGRAMWPYRLCCGLVAGAPSSPIRFSSARKRGSLPMTASLR